MSISRAQLRAYNGRLAIPAVCLLLGVATPNPAQANTTVIVVNNTTIQIAQEKAEEAADVAGTIANFDGAGQAFFAAMNWLESAVSNTDSPDYPYTVNSPIYTAIYDASSDASLWSAVLRYNDIGSALENGLEYASDCTGPADCNIWNPNVPLYARLSEADSTMKQYFTTCTQSINSVGANALVARIYAKELGICGEGRTYGTGNASETICRFLDMGRELCVLAFHASRFPNSRGIFPDALVCGSAASSLRACKSGNCAAHCEEWFVGSSCG